MTDIVERLRFDAARCEATFSKGVASNIEEAVDEIERLRAALKPFADWYEQYKWGEYPRDMNLPDEKHVEAWMQARDALGISDRKEGS